MKFKVGFVDKRGYKFMWCPKHPFVRKDCYMQEHRLIMEKHLRRYLTKKERIHHINRKKGDNRIKNLQLFPDESTHQSTIPRKGKEFVYKGRVAEYMRKHSREWARKKYNRKPRYENKGGYNEQILCRG